MGNGLRQDGAKSGMGVVAKLAIVIALIAAVGLAVHFKQRNGAPAPGHVRSHQATADAEAPNDPASETDKRQAASPAASLPRLMDLGADKCIPCKMMAPMLEELRKEYAGVFDVEFIDVWKNRGAAQKYGVRMIPTQIFFDASGKELYRHQGFYSKEDILAKWKELGVDLGDGNDSESK